MNDEKLFGGKILSIGIPTYRRPESLANLLSQISTTPVLHENVEVIVINDSGSDDFNNEYEKALKLLGGGKI